MKVACLMGTYGRYSLVCKSLSCFLQQSAISQACLLIYNQHQVPLQFDHPKVKVVNEVSSGEPLRFIRHRMIELADPSAEFIHWWDDDDLYLPWHLEDCVQHISQNVAWKPASSWMSERNVKFSMHSNQFEASWLFRSDYLKAAPLDTHPTYMEHPVFLQTEERKQLATTELGGRTSYIYRWDTGTQHLSGYGDGDEHKQRSSVESWRRHSNDVKADGQLVPADMLLRWQQYLEGTKDKISPTDWEWNHSRLKQCLL